MSEIKTKYKDFPEGSMLSLMKLDITASKRREEICIFYDETMPEGLEKLLFAPQIRLLDFVFEDGTVRPLGARIDRSLVPYLKKCRQMTLFQMDMQKKRAVHGFEVPIELVEAPPSPAKKAVFDAFEGLKSTFGAKNKTSKGK